MLIISNLKSSERYLGSGASLSHSLHWNTSTAIAKIHFKVLVTAAKFTRKFHFKVLTSPVNLSRHFFSFINRIHTPFLCFCFFFLPVSWKLAWHSLSCCRYLEWNRVAVIVTSIYTIKLFSMLILVYFFFGLFTCDFTRI